LDLRILVIEDESQLAELIQRGLEEEGYAVDAAASGETGEELVESVPYDLVVLDIILPGKDGLEVCRDLRDKKLKMPILMLTAKDAIEDKVKGLDCGADDYMAKPFVFEELYARVRALLRREENLVSQKVELGDVVIDTTTRQVWRGGTEVTLTPKEYSIFEYLARHPNMVITRVMLEQHVWNLELDSTSNLVDVFIRKLRRKLDSEGESLIQTVKGAGYRLRSP
jgi:DNA-binding response OmpR family regulator